MAKRTKKDLSTRTSAGAQADAFAIIDRARPATQLRAGGLTRIIAVPLGDILPDPSQARVVLPPELFRRFYFPDPEDAAMDCYQVAGSLLESAPHDPYMRAQVDRLIELGESILQHGQIEPATGYHETGPGGEFIRLLVGERRFWSLAIMTMHLGLEQEPTLNVILKDGYNVGEQLAENLQRDDLTAVDLAKGIASLILNARGQPPDPTDPHYLARLREAEAIRKLPDGVWESVQEHIPHSRRHLSRLLSLLRLPDELLYVAAVSKLPESILREILAAHPSDWKELVYGAAAENYTAEEIREAVESAQRPVKKDKNRAGHLTVHRRMGSRINSLVKLANQNDFQEDFGAVAGEVSAGYEDPEDVAIVGHLLARLAEALLQNAERRRN